MRTNFKNNERKDISVLNKSPRGFRYNSFPIHLIFNFAGKIEQTCNLLRFWFNIASNWISVFYFYYLYREMHMNIKQKIFIITLLITGIFLPAVSFADADKIFKENNKAVEDCNKAIALNPNDARAYYNLGNAYVNKVQYDRAMENYNKALALDPSLALAYANRGGAYAKKGQYDRAIEDCNKAIALDPNDANAYYNRGLVYGIKGQYDRAIEDCNKAIALDPNLAEAYITRGLAYFLSGNMGRAISDLQKACDMGDENGCKALQMALKKR